jgi:hypothetical protein
MIQPENVLKIQSDFWGQPFSQTAPAPDAVQQFWSAVAKRERDTALANANVSDLLTRMAEAKAPSSLRSAGAVHKVTGCSPAILECGGKA